jgi:hypothetical protein
MKEKKLVNIIVFCLNRINEVSNYCFLNTSNIVFIALEKSACDIRQKKKEKRTHYNKIGRTYMLKPF